MSISTNFGNAPQWAQTYFGGMGLGDVRCAWRVVRLGADARGEHPASEPGRAAALAGGRRLARHRPRPGD